MESSTNKWKKSKSCFIYLFPISRYTTMIVEFLIAMLYCEKYLTKCINYWPFFISCSSTFIITLWYGFHFYLFYYWLEMNLSKTCTSWFLTNIWRVTFIFVIYFFKSFNVFPKFFPISMITHCRLLNTKRPSTLLTRPQDHPEDNNSNNWE